MDMSSVATKEATADTANVGHGLFGAAPAAGRGGTAVPVGLGGRSGGPVSFVTELTVAVSSPTKPTSLPDVSRTDTSDWPCTIARSADLLGDGWNLLIIRQACLGARRFDEFRTALGIGRNVLTTHLNRLVDEDVLVRVPYQEHPRRHEYRLTDKGRDAFGVLAAMAAWGERWLSGPEGTPLVLHHTACDHDMTAEVVCGHCHGQLELREVRAMRGPGHPAAMPGSAG